MVKQHQRTLPEILHPYWKDLRSKVGKVRILGEGYDRDLKEVFVELSVVDRHAPQQYSKFLGLMDNATRRRLNPIGATEAKRSIRSNQLLRRGTKAIITGAPGCGKTTLLKYLALQELRKKKLTVWLELKTIDKALFDQVKRVAGREGTMILSEIWLEFLRKFENLSDSDVPLLRAYWQERLKANEVAVFLDGFDELQDEAIEVSLDTAIREFASASHHNTLILSTRPYAEHKLGKEQLQELEIEPLNQRQIKAFLNCYYPNDPATNGFLRALREQSSLRELLHVPLLLGVILDLYKKNKFKDNRLDIYKTIVADLVDDTSRGVRRHFRINDIRLRLDFLKFLAFERLLCDSSEEDQVVNRIVFSYDLLKEKARKFLTQEGLYHNPRNMADDVLSTPLLREVSMDTFAFTHLTLQEYLAARAFADFYERRENDGLEVFRRAYHNPTIVEMEVLPMMLGATSNADKLCGEIERWPESLTFANLRLRARGLAFGARIQQPRMSNLIDRLLDFTTWKNAEETPYRELVIKSFLGMSTQAIDLLETKAEGLFESDKHYCNYEEWPGDEVPVITGGVSFNDLLSPGKTEPAKKDETKGRYCFDNAPNYHRAVKYSEAIKPLGRLGSDKVVAIFITALQDEDDVKRASAVDALREIGSEKAIHALVVAARDGEGYVRGRAIQELGEIGSDEMVDFLLETLQHRDRFVRLSAAGALEKIGSGKARGALIAALKDEDDGVRFFAADALGEIGSDEAIAPLVALFQDPQVIPRWHAISALEQIGSPKAVEALVAALQHEDSYVRSSAAEALTRIDSDMAVDTLSVALRDQDYGVRSSAAATLGRIGSDEAFVHLIAALQHKDSHTRWSAADTLGQIGSPKAVESLIVALEDENCAVRRSAADALGQIGSDKAFSALKAALQDEDRNVRWQAASSLGRIGSDEAIDILISALQSGDDFSRSGAAHGLEAIASEKTIDVLITALQDSESGVRYNAVGALGRISSDQAIEALIATLQHQDDSLRDRAAEVLAQIKAKALISGLAWTVRRGSVFTRKKAAAVIAYYSTDRQTLSLLRQLTKNDKDSEVRKAASEAAKSVVGRLEFSSPEDNPKLNNVSKEAVLANEVGLIVSKAGHIFREVFKYDEGIDGEIEFRDETGRGSGRRVYLQLKSGDSYLTRQRSGKEIFRIKKPRHPQYWLNQPCPVLLVIRDSGGRIRWMNVTEYLQLHGSNIKQIEFHGELFTTESVKRMRDSVTARL